MSEYQKFKGYTPAQLRKGKSWFIEFYAWEPKSGQLKRKRIKLNFINSKKERARYAKELIKKLNIQLADGWNPWIDSASNLEYTYLNTAIDQYLKQAKQKHQDSIIRRETYDDYLSYMNVFRKYLKEKGRGDLMVYELSRKIIVQFLDYIYYEKKRTPLTRNNYLNHLRVFSGWLVEHEYLQSRPTESIKNLQIKTGTKQRTVITPEHLKQIRNYLAEHDRYYLLAVEFIYYTFVRPREMSFLQVKHINFNQGTVTIPADISKNKTNGIVTIPDKLGRIIIDLEIHKAPADYYIFGSGCRPAAEFRSGKQFREKWLKLRKALKLPETYKFYSLKDTGITDMLKATNDTIAVRNQARHHSISMTNTYTDFSHQGGNETIRKLDY